VFVHVGRDDQETRQRLAQVFALADMAPPEDDLIVREGRPDLVLLKAAKEYDADMIVLGALERDNVVSELIGSTARRVARRAECSVFLLVGSVDEQAAWHTVVASVEFDEASMEMLNRIASLANTSPSARIHVIREYDPHARPTMEGASAQSMATGKYPGMYAPMYAYTDKDGRGHEITDSVSSNPKPYAVGEQVTMLYNPDDPTDAKVDSFWSLHLFTFIAGVFASIGLMAALFLLIILPLIFGFATKKPAPPQPPGAPTA
jgi:hypothetical protein